MSRLDSERCIMLSLRAFCDEVAKSRSSFLRRGGDHVELTTFPGERLDNPYAMNTIDLCPVGALTSTDFRFKARVWEMSSTDGVCVGCARGCNMKMWVRNNEILRLTPRLNPDVNDYWMCDAGRLTTFQSVNAADRVGGPMVRRDDALVDASWDEAISAVVSALKAFNKTEIAAIGSPFATNEDNYLLSKFMQYLGVRSMDVLKHEHPGDEDQVLIRADKLPTPLARARLAFVPRRMPTVQRSSERSKKAR
jgi:NADH-quinone oxidoreductase subunit G